ncbi:hypothetical protein BT69DRAFT_488071 [Atractiella rhizophila]|nr:hypothetical protein BT69DRAFT_488071 [Atractiella rhizophila]
MRGSPISKPIRPSAQNFHHSSLHHSHSPPSPVPRQRSFHTPPPAIKDIENKSRLTKKDETKEKRKEKKEKNSDGRPSYPNQKQIPNGPGTGSTTNVTAEVGGRGGREKGKNKIMEEEDEDDTDEDFQGTLRRLLPSTSASTSVIKASESGASTPRPQTLKLKLKLPPGAQAQVRKPSAEKKVALPGGGKVKTTKVMRKFKRRDTADEMDTDGEESSLSEVRSVGDGKEGEDAKGYYESSEGEDSEEETTEVVVITELPPHPGKAPEEGGVVTWSDYELEDFADGGWAIEVSSPELKGVDDEMWFSKLDSQGPSEAEDGDHPLLVIDSWNGLDTTEDDRANSDLLSEDDGETTDSLDEDDHVALVRFGIEVEEPPVEPLIPMTTSLAELELSGQPSPDEAMSPPSASDNNQAAPHSLPAELSATISMEALANDPEKVLTEAAKSLGVDLETAASILTGVGMSVIFTHEGGSSPSSKRKLRHKRKKKEGQERSLRKVTAKNLTETDAPSEPVMGTFLIHSDSGRSVIDGKKPPASPFSRKPGSVRPSRANSSERVSD